MKKKYWVITGLDEGIGIEAYVVEGTENAISCCETYGDCVRYREGFSTYETAKCHADYENYLCTKEYDVELEELIGQGFDEIEAHKIIREKYLNKEEK